MFGVAGCERSTKGRGKNKLAAPRGGSLHFNVSVDHNSQMPAMATDFDSYDEHAWPDPGPSRRPSRPRPRPHRRASSWSDHRKYAIIIDAGSSGSRLQIYSWTDARIAASERKAAHKKLKVLPKVEKGTQTGEWQWKVEPGISSFAGRVGGLDAYLGELFDRAKGVIPDDQLSSTPVYVLATAGMRLLPANQQDEIVQSICEYISKRTPFALRGGCKEHVQVISGEQEGLLGWIAINYLMDGFHFQPDTEDQTITQGNSTFGFLDMGGASTQIAFEPSQSVLAGTDSQAQKEDLTSVTLRLLDGSKVKHDVFVTTFLGFGTNKARERYEERLLSSSSRPTYDPCLPTGATTPALNSSGITGQGSFSECLTSLSPLLDKNAPCSHPPCLFHGIHVPPINFSLNHFIGVSEYWYSSDDVFHLGGTYDYVEFQRAAQTFCKRPWAELESSHGEFPPQIDSHRLKMQCFKAAWMVTVLHDGIGLPRVIDSKGKGDGKDHADEVGYKAGQKNLAGAGFQSVNEIEGTAVSWTLGKAVLEASQDGRMNGLAGYRDYLSSPGRILLSAGLVWVLIFVLLFTLGKSPAAQRRRKMLTRYTRRVFRPCSSNNHDDEDGAGEYMLANMEEGQDSDTEIERNGDGEEEEKHHRHQPTSSRWTSFIPLPIRRILINTTPSPHRRGPAPGPPPALRRVVSASTMRDSRSTSPSLANLTLNGALISRPASRSGITRPASRAAGVGAGAMYHRSSPLVSPSVTASGHGQSQSYFPVGSNDTSQQEQQQSHAWTTSLPHTPNNGGSLTPNVLQQGGGVVQTPFTMQSISQALDRNVVKAGGKKFGAAGTGAGVPSAGFLTPVHAGGGRVGKNK